MASTSEAPDFERSNSRRAARVARSTVPSPSAENRRSLNPMNRRTQRSLVSKTFACSGESSMPRSERMRMRSSRSRAATRELLQTSAGACAASPAIFMPRRPEVTRALPGVEPHPEWGRQDQCREGIPGHLRSSIGGGGGPSRSGPLGRPSREQLVALGGEDEVVLVEALDLVRPGLHHDLAPRQVQVGVMLLALRQFADLDREVHRLAEVLEAVLAADALDPVDLRHLPLGHLRLERRDLLVGERGDAAPAGDASFFGESSHSRYLRGMSGRPRISTCCGRRANRTTGRRKAPSDQVRLFQALVIARSPPSNPWSPWCPGCSPAW